MLAPALHISQQSPNGLIVALFQNMLPMETFLEGEKEGGGIY